MWLFFRKLLGQLLVSGGSDKPNLLVSKAALDRILYKAIYHQAKDVELRYETAAMRQHWLETCAERVEIAAYFCKAGEDQPPLLFRSEIAPMLVNEIKRRISHQAGSTADCFLFLYEEEMAAAINHYERRYGKTGPSDAEAAGVYNVHVSWPSVQLQKTITMHLVKQEG